MADIEVRPGQDIETSMDWGVTGLTLRVSILDGAGATVYGPSSTGITEYPASSGRYEVTLDGLSTSGAYRAWWDNGSTGPGNVAEGDSIQVSGAAFATGRDLCTVDDVIALVPGFTADSTLEDLIQTLITSESRDAHAIVGREIKAISPAVSPRDFDVTRWMVRHRRVKVGDMTTVSSVTVLSRDRSTTLETVATTDRTSLPLVREEWEPIREVRLEGGGPSPAALAEGYVVRVAGAWGWPAVPENLVIAVAKMVLVRYLEDAASDGTPLADALDEVGFNAGRAFVSARETIRRFGRKPQVA